MKLIGKLQDGTVFVKKGHDEQEPFEFKTDEGLIALISYFCCLHQLCKGRSDS